MFVCVDAEKIMTDVVKEWQQKFPEEVREYMAEQKLFLALEDAGGRDVKGFTKGRTMQLVGRIPARIIKGVEFFTQDADFWTKDKGKNLFKFTSMFPAFGGKDTGWRPR